MTSKRTKKPVAEEAAESTEVKPEKKTVMLKQFLVHGQKNPDDPESERTSAFILHTCALNARKEFEERFGMKVTQCNQTAESTLSKDDLPKHDFWKEHRNWQVEKQPKAEMSESAKRYFEMKDRAEKVQAAKAKLKIRDWETATEDQLKALHEMLNKKS